ncbi:MAG: NeuD/PglB/VioB family sugar acetyltransferase [Chloroflexota bacterium]
MEAIQILVPLLNANEPEAKLVRTYVKDGQLVNQGDILFSLETTKATSDIEAPVSGFIHLSSIQDDIVTVGDLLAWISGKKDDIFDIKQVESVKNSMESLRITQPARSLAAQLGIDLKKLPTDQLITESMIRDFTKEASIFLPDSLSINPERSILIYGGGGHAKSVMEMLKSIKDYEIVGIIDDNIPAKTYILDIPVLGPGSVLLELRKMGVLMSANGVGGILDINIRKRIFEVLERNDFALPKLIHPRSTLESSASVKDGVQIFANAYIGSDAVLESCCMINTNAVVSHDCLIGAYSHIAPGALLAGHVQVGEASLVGMGVTIAIGIKIGNNVRVGNGAIIYADVPSKTIIPSGTIWAGKTK